MSPPSASSCSEESTAFNSQELELKFGKNAEEDVDPRRVIHAVLSRYYNKKTMYREASHLYSFLNLWLFFIPLLLIQAVTSVLTNVSTMHDVNNRTTYQHIVLVLNAFSVFWLAAQLKLSWGEKADKDHEAMLRYRNLEWENRQYHLILCSLPDEIKPTGILKFLNQCHTTERKILSESCPVPWFIVNKFIGAPDQSYDATDVELDAIPKVASSTATAAKRSAGIRTFHYGEDYEEYLSPMYLLNRMQKRYWRRKNLYREGARYFWYLTLGVFFAPTMAIQTANTILPVFIDSTEKKALVATILNGVVTMILAAQMKLMWGEKSSQCEGIYYIYRLLESEVNYRFLLLEEGVKLTDLVAFSWACREIERKGVTTVPRLPDCLVSKWRGKIPENKPHRARSYKNPADTQSKNAVHPQNEPESKLTTQLVDTESYKITVNSAEYR